MRKYNHNRRHQKEQKHHSLGIVLVLCFIALLISFFYFLFKLFTLDKFIYVNKLNDGSSEIVVADSDEDRVVKYLIPSSVDVDSSRNYGVYKLGSLWSLGEKDGTNGKLITESITKNFCLPVFLWKDGNRTNLNLFQRIKSFWLGKKRMEYQSTIDTDKIAESVYINFTDSKMAESIPSVEIDDLTGELGVIDRVSKIIDVLGGKITSNSKGYEKELDCEISGKNKEILKTFSEVFGCKVVGADNQTITDVRIRLGAKFAERF